MIDVATCMAGSIAVCRLDHHSNASEVVQRIPKNHDQTWLGRRVIFDVRAALSLSIEDRYVLQT